MTLYSNANNSKFSVPGSVRVVDNWLSSEVESRLYEQKKLLIESK